MPELLPLYGKTLAELQDIVSQEGLPPYAAMQLADWLYKKNVESIEAMTNISRSAREQLVGRYCVGLNKPKVFQLRPMEPKNTFFGAEMEILSRQLIFRKRKGNALRIVTGRMQNGLPFLHDWQAGISGNSFLR
jgi:hypothetical protein